MTAPLLDLDRLFAPVQRIDAYLAKTLDQPMCFTPPNLQEAMKYAVLAGRLAFEAGRMPKKLYASASSPLVGLVG